MRLACCGLVENAGLTGSSGEVISLTADRSYRVLSHKTDPFRSEGVFLLGVPRQPRGKGRPVGPKGTRLAWLYSVSRIRFS